METAKEMSKQITNFTNSNYGVGVTGKINRYDPANLTGDNQTVYLSLYIKKKECRLKNLNIKNNKITLAGFMTIISVLNDTQYSMQKINCSCNAIDNLPKRLPNYTHVNVKSLKIGGHNYTIDDLSYLLDFLNLNK